MIIQFIIQNKYKLIDHVFALMPFEEEYLKNATTKLRKKKYRKESWRSRKYEKEKTALLMENRIALII